MSLLEVELLSYAAPARCLLHDDPGEVAVWWSVIDFKPETTTGSQILRGGVDGPESEACSQHLRPSSLRNSRSERPSAIGEWCSRSTGTMAWRQGEQDVR